MKNFSRIICFLFICAFTLLSFGCFRSPNDTYDLYGVKVLYRPDHYTYAGGDGIDEDYYGAYAWSILNELMLIYGTTSLTTATLTNYGVNTEYQKYYYDSIRYNFVSQDNYNAGKIVYVEDADGTIDYNGKKYTQTEEYEDEITTITMNTSLSWKWTFESDSEPEGYIYKTENNVLDSLSVTDNGYVSNMYYVDNDGISEYFVLAQAYYSTTNTLDRYTQVYVGSDNKTAEENPYSDLIKALKYVIYCYSLDVTPSPIDVESDSVTGKPIVKIGGYNSVDDAVEFIEGVFDDIGTYVGIDNRRRELLKTYILKNVIGQNAIDADEKNGITITTYSNPVEEYRDADGNVVAIVTDASNNSVAIKTDYAVRNYETVVGNVVDLICDRVTIGTDTTVDERYARSYIKDYYGSQFFTSSDSGHEFDGIPAMEYQSVVLMPDKKMTIENLWLDFKYDGDYNADGSFNRDSSITIEVSLNLFHSGDTQPQKVETKTITVPAETYNPGYESNTLCFDGIGGAAGFTVGAFADSLIQEGSIMLPPGMKYDGSVMISDELKILGTSLLKNYYTVSDENDEIMLNHKQFAGVCDYFEIVYKVIKVHVDKAEEYTPKNYKFYTGISLLR